MNYLGRSPGVGTKRRFVYFPAEGATAISGADRDGRVMTYNPQAMDVFLNGVQLLRGPSDNYTADNGTSITVHTPLGAGSVVVVETYGTWVSAGAYSPSDVATPAEITAAIGGNPDAQRLVNLAQVHQMINALGSKGNGWEVVHEGEVINQNPGTTPELLFDLQPHNTSLGGQFKLEISHTAMGADATNDGRLRLAFSSNNGAAFNINGHYLTRDRFASTGTTTYNRELLSSNVDYLEVFSNNNWVSAPAALELKIIQSKADTIYLQGWSRLSFDYHQLQGAVNTLSGLVTGIYWHQDNASADDHVDFKFKILKRSS